LTNSNNITKSLHKNQISKDSKIDYLQVYHSWHPTFDPLTTKIIVTNPNNGETSYLNLVTGELSTPIPYRDFPRVWQVGPHVMSAAQVRNFRSSFLSVFTSLYQGYWLSFTSTDRQIRAQRLQQQREFEEKQKSEKILLQKQKSKEEKAANKDSKKLENKDDEETIILSNKSPAQKITSKTIELKKIPPYDHSCHRGTLIHNTQDELFKSYLGFFSTENQTFSHFLTQRQSTLVSTESIRTWRRQWSVVRKVARDRARLAARELISYDLTKDDVVGHTEEEGDDKLAQKNTNKTKIDPYIFQDFIQFTRQHYNTPLTQSINQNDPATWSKDILSII
jgi:hypothetical protein